MIWMLAGLAVAVGLLMVTLAMRRRVAERAWHAELDLAFARDDAVPSLGHGVLHAAPRHRSSPQA